MSLPTDLAADLTNPADEVADSQFVPEADPAFDADPLTDATASTETKGDMKSFGIAAMVIGAIIFVVGAGLLFTGAPDKGAPIAIAAFGGLVLGVGVYLFL